MSEQRTHTGWSRGRLPVASGGGGGPQPDGIGGGTCTHVGTLVALLASWVWHCNHVVVAN